MAPGVLTWLDGSKYDGEWANDVKHGQGMKNLETKCIRLTMTGNERQKKRGKK
jgi:hypothetical protein